MGNEADDLKKTALLFISIIWFVVLAGCGKIDDTTKRDFFNAQTSIFNTLEVKDGDIITADFDVYLAETEAAFLFVEVTEDMKATIHYTYSTQHEDGINLGYYLEGTRDKTTFTLAGATEEALYHIGRDEEIVLQKGTNIFYVAGDKCHCNMHFEINDFDKSKIAYVNAYAKGKALEKSALLE